MITETIPELVNLAFTYSEKLCSWGGSTGDARVALVEKRNSVLGELGRRIGEEAVDSLMTAFEEELESTGCVTR